MVKYFTWNNFRIELEWAQKIESIWIEGKFIGECSEHALCKNTEGSYQCECKNGFNGDGFKCTNIDECEDSKTSETDGGPSNIICSEFAHCLDTAGSFKDRDFQILFNLYVN